MKQLISLFQITCIFHKITGLYCPGCGGTRAFIAFISGHFIQSFIYHPIVEYSFLCILYIFFRRLTNKKYHPNISMLWVALIIIVLNFVIKNIFLFYGYDLLNM